MRRKYHNKKVVLGDKTFDSKKESSTGDYGNGYMQQYDGPPAGEPTNYAIVDYDDSELPY